MPLTRAAGWLMSCCARSHRSTYRWASNLIKRDTVKFFNEAYKRSKYPKMSFKELVAFVEHCGLKAEQCINFSADQWNVPANRTAKAGRVLLRIIKHLQRSCKYCGESFEDMMADGMKSIHLDHRDHKTKYSRPSRYSPGQFVVFSSEAAFEEWAKCKATCTKCHD